ncbi:hypothetical protein ABS71_16335, partial [bacterium SCN 62-11]
MKNSWKLALAALYICGCGGGNSPSGFSGGSQGAQAGLVPPGLPARIASASDPYGGINEDLSAAGDATFRVNLQPGWNALAFQVDFVTQIQAGPEVIGFVTYENNRYADPLPLNTDTVNRGDGASLGVFIYADRAGVLTYRGTPHNGISFSGLEPGWNLVAPPSLNLSELSWNEPIFEIGRDGQAVVTDQSADPSLPIWVYSSSIALLAPPYDDQTQRTITISGALAPLPARNLPDSQIRCNENLRQQGPATRNLAAVSNTRWDTGSTLRVLLMDGNAVPDSVYQEVGKLLRDNFEANCNIHFTFVTGPVSTPHDISLKFLADEGFSSQLGTNSRGVNPSMYLSNLHKRTVDDDYRNTVLHEFGHALGMGHEHQSPNANILWNREFIYNYYAGPPNQWDR